MALELNVARAVPNAFQMSPRQIQAMWLSYHFGIRPRLERQEAQTMRWAQAEEKSFEKWVKSGG